MCNHLSTVCFLALTGIPMAGLCAAQEPSKLPPAATPSQGPAAAPGSRGPASAAPNQGPASGQPTLQSNQRLGSHPAFGIGMGTGYFLNPYQGFASSAYRMNPYIPGGYGMPYAGAYGSGYVGSGYPSTAGASPYGYGNVDMSNSPPAMLSSKSREQEQDGLDTLLRASDTPVHPHHL